MHFSDKLVLYVGTLIFVSVIDYIV